MVPPVDLDIEDAQRVGVDGAFISQVGDGLTGLFSGRGNSRGPIDADGN